MISSTARRLPNAQTLSRDGRVAWFDELLDSANYGECRGTGALEKVDGRWLIVQYHLTIPMPNDLAREFVARIREARKAPGEPKGHVQGPPDAFVSRPGERQKDLETLDALLDRFVKRGPASEWPPHALFGPMSGKDWGYFCYKHFDHHLRQFGQKRGVA